MTSPRAHGGLWARLVRGTRWAWRNERFQEGLPADLDDTVMSLESRDRLHAKQGRSTARVIFQGPSGPMPVYLKRHFRLPWTARLAALVHPSGSHTPGSAEFTHLERARRLGLAVPEVVAVGERIGPWGNLQSYLMVAELTGERELNEALPDLARRMPVQDFEQMKKQLVREVARLAATLHNAHHFHKDLYLCHFFLHELDRRLTLIDLHRLAEHRLFADRWLWKDLGQLLYSTEGVDGISSRDRLRFWVHYRRLTHLKHDRWHARMVGLKAAQYLRHNQGRD
jgi:Lipopolysaccharide kinase (Kdo/WaaP) family